MATLGPEPLVVGEEKNLRSINWTRPLNGETLAASEWFSSDDALEIISDSFTTTHTVVRVSASAVGTYTVQNTVTWSDGQIRFAYIEVEATADLVT